MIDKETDDLISIGTIGLIKAIDTFDDEKGIRLATYASRCIDNAILS
jgi:RNA polymerase sporulation-specific sigma factor